jgi:hypothetical protein
MLLSGGGFAVYRGILPVYEKLIPRFGGFDNPASRERAVEAFLRSNSFRRSGLEAESLRAKLLNDCRSGGDFIRIVMDEIAQTQGLSRWIVYNPDNLPRLPMVKRDILDALFIHIVRDGRDIALSLGKMGGFDPFPWDRAARSLSATALYWEWMVRKGREYGKAMGGDYIEVRYEELATKPEMTLKRLGEFLDHELDYERIRKAGLGRLSETNSSFPEEAGQGGASPVNRWRERLSPQEVAGLEAMVGDSLTEFGYSLSSPEKERQHGVREQWMRFSYRSYLDAKLWLKTNTLAGRLASLSRLELLDAGSGGNNPQL